MDRSKWEEILVRFQACARGYLVRKEVRRACGDFEDIVREIDGSLAHLKWKDAAISIPHFTDTDGPLLTWSPPGQEVSASVQHPSPAERGETGHCLLSERTEAERDDSHIRGEACLSGDPSSPVRVDGETQREGSPGVQTEDKDGDGGVMESAGGSTSVWSSFGLDVNSDYSFKAFGYDGSTQCADVTHRSRKRTGVINRVNNGFRYIGVCRCPGLWYHAAYAPAELPGPPQSCLAQDVPRTPEALRLHRNTLTMELIWLQQAIDSRKKYLSLKDRLSVS